MAFVHPERLWLLAAWGLMVLWAIRARWRRRSGWEAAAQRGKPPREGGLWWLWAMACLVVALAQPKWGRLGLASAPGHDVVLMIDVSRSMGAEDAVPSRMAAAVEYAEKLVEAIAAGLDNRVGVVAFAGRGVLECPVTENLGAVVEVLHRLQPGSVQPGGTDLGAGLDAALEALGGDEHAGGQSIVVISDGEDLADRWKPRLDRLIDREVIVYGITVGDAEHGHPVPSGREPTRPMVYRGKAVESRRSDSALREIASQTRGLVVPLGLAPGDPSVLYRNQIEPSARRRARVPRIADMADQFPLFLVAAMSCLVAACWPPGRGWSWPWPWPWRIGWGWGWGWSWRWRRGRRRRAEAIARAALMAIAVGLFLGASQAPEPNEPPQAAAPGGSISAHSAVTKGRAAYNERRFQDALASFEAAIRVAPAAPVPRFDAAAALFQLGRYDQARDRYAEARTRADEVLRIKIDYAMGNTALALGDVPGAIAAYDSCIGSTARGTDLDAIRRDAAINRDFAIQQNPSPMIPEGQGADEPSAPRGSDRRRSSHGGPGDDGPSAEGDDEAGSSAGGPNARGQNDQDGHNRWRRRRTGGAGGSGTTPPGATGDSREDRLDAALDNIRAARASRRLPDEPSPPSTSGDGRDW